MNAQAIKITAISAFNDNYIWAIKEKNNPYLVLVDPGDAQVCIDYITEHKLKLAAILITHHHHDHVGGIEALIAFCLKNNMAVTVYGPAKENIPYCDISLSETERFTITAINASFTILDVPGHTTGHIAYLQADNLFCGDTLFSVGCGRLFEGTAAQLHQSLNKLKSLPEHTKVYCSHEYTQANITFALAVEPENKTLVSYALKVKQLRANAEKTLPSTIKLEKSINPFLRCHEENIQKKVEKYLADNTKVAITNIDEQHTFKGLRLWKDNF